MPMRGKPFTPSRRKRSVIPKKAPESISSEGNETRPLPPKAGPHCSVRGGEKSLRGEKISGVSERREIAPPTRDRENIRISRHMKAAAGGGSMSLREGTFR